MTLQIKNAKRIFLLIRDKESDNVTLPDPNPNMGPEDVQRFYSSEYPELTSSTVTGPSMKEGDAVYSFQTIIGDKG